VHIVVHNHDTYYILTHPTYMTYRWNLECSCSGCVGDATECEGCWAGWDKKSSFSSSYLWQEHWPFNKL